MGSTTDDGFIAESRDRSQTDQAGETFRWIVLAADETEALQILQADMPTLDHFIVASGGDVRAQAARLGVEPGTYRKI